MADHVGISAEFVGPQAVAEDGDIVSAGLGVFIGQEKASRGRTHAQKVEIAGADHLSLKLARLGTATPRQRERTDHTGRRGEKLGLARVILKIHVGHTELDGVGRGHASFAVDGVHLDDPRDIFDRQGIQQDGVDHGENGGVGSDAQGQRKNGDKAERRIFG